MSKIKGYLIDPYQKKINQNFEIENTLEGYYKVLDCTMIQGVPINNGMMLICDEEHFFKTPPSDDGNYKGIRLKGWHSSITGKMFICNQGIEDWESLTGSQIISLEIALMQANWTTVYPD